MSVIPSTDQDFEDMIQHNKKVVVKYFANWCGNCKLFAPKFRRLSEDERFKDIVFLSVNAEENEKARKLAGVNNLPYFAAFKDGELLKGNATSKEDTVLELLSEL